MKNFALIGAAGFVAPRHMRAIRETGNQLVAAVDPNDSVGVIDSYAPNARFFTEIERFDRHLEKLRRAAPEERVEYVSICSPNYLHDAHVRLALRVRAHAICEKPLVINPWNLDQLAAVEEETDKRVHTILQLRHHQVLLDLRERLASESRSERHDVALTYITRRGRWYDVSWKGVEGRSGGLTMNIGIHFFDALMWLFGECHEVRMECREGRRAGGILELERARVRWFLSSEAEDLPSAVRDAGGHAHRSIEIDGEDLEFTKGFTDLHTRSYEEILAGRGFGIEDAKPSISLVHKVRTNPLQAPSDASHPGVRGR